MLTYSKHVETTALKCKKGPSVQKAIAAKGIEERHLFLLYESVVLSVIDYGLGLTTMAQTNLLKLDRVQNEAMRVILGTTKDTPIETMRFILDLPSMQTRQKVKQDKAYFSVVENPHNPLHDAVKNTKGCSLGRGKSWMDQADNSILQVCQLTAQANQGVGKIPKLIPAFMRDTPSRKPGKALSRMGSRQNRVKLVIEKTTTQQQQTAGPHRVH